MIHGLVSLMMILLPFGMQGGNGAMIGSGGAVISQPGVCAQDCQGPGSCDIGPVRSGGSGGNLNVDADRDRDRDRDRTRTCPEPDPSRLQDRDRDRVFRPTF